MEVTCFFLCLLRHLTYIKHNRYLCVQSSSQGKCLRFDKNLKGFTLTDTWRSKSIKFISKPKLIWKTNLRPTSASNIYLGMPDAVTAHKFHKNWCNEIKMHFLKIFSYFSVICIIFFFIGILSKVALRLNIDFYLFQLETFLYRAYMKKYLSLMTF